MWVYSANETVFSNNGLGEIPDALSAKITEAINGDYLLEVAVLISNPMASNLVEGNIIKAKRGSNDFQLFSIKRVVKTFQTITLYCYHIFYDLLDNLLVNTAPTNLNCTAFGTWILQHMNYDMTFTFSSDIASTASARYVRKNPVEAMIGTEANSMVNRFGGEIVRNNFSIALNAHRGNDNGVRLIIGKNITQIQTTADITSLVTRIVPLGFDGLMLPEIYVDSPLIANYPSPKIAKIDFNDVRYDPTGEDGFADVEDAYTEMRNRCNALFTAGIDLPQINVKVDWLELSKVEGYKHIYSDLERVSLGDTITLQLLGFNYTTEVKKVIYNVLTDMTEKFEIGTLNATIASGIHQAMQAAENNAAISFLDAARENATDLITSAMGGYIYKTDSELFIMDAPNPEDAVRVWRWNINGLGYSSSGISGPYETAITMDGQIVANFITTGTLQTSVIDGMDQIVLRIATNEGEISKFNSYFTFDDNGLTIGKDGSDYTNVLDNQGMTVSYQGNAVLTANNEGVHANAFVVDGLWNIDTLDVNGYVLGFWRKA